MDNYWVTLIAGREWLGGSRITLADRPRRSMFLCDGKLRLQRGRPMAVSAPMFQKYLKEFERLAGAKVIKVQVGGPMGKDYSFAEADAPVPPPPPPETVVAPEPEPAVEDKPVAKPIDKMTKAELIKHLAGQGVTEEDLALYSKKQLQEEAYALAVEEGK